MREEIYALDAISYEAVWILGPIAVGVLVAVSGAAVALLTTAAITLVGTLVFTAAASTVPQPDAAPAVPRRSALVSRPLRLLLCVMFVTGAVWGVLAVALPALAVSFGSDTDAGLAVALIGVGSLGGGLAYASASITMPLTRRYPILLLLIAAVALPLELARNGPELLGLSVLAGLPWAALMSCEYALVGELAPPRAVTEAFTWSSAALVGGVSGGSAATGWLVGYAGTRGAILLASGLATLAASIAFIARTGVSGGTHE